MDVSLASSVRGGAAMATDKKKKKAPAAQVCPHAFAAAAAPPSLATAAAPRLGEAAPHAAAPATHFGVEVRAKRPRAPCAGRPPRAVPPPDPPVHTPRVVVGS